MNCPPLKAVDGGVRCSLGGPELSETTTGQRRDVRDSGATVVLDDSRHFHSAPRIIVMFMRSATFQNPWISKRAKIEPDFPPATREVSHPAPSP